MNGYNGLSYEHYRPYDRIEEKDNPYICAVFPCKTSVKIQWKYKKYEGTFYIGEDGADVFESKKIDKRIFVIDNLKENTDYIVYIVSDGIKSNERRIRTGKYPFTLVNYLNPVDNTYEFSGNFLGSPSLLKLKNGDYLASMDVFKGKAPQRLTLIFRSCDKGRTWEYSSELYPCFWGKLFLNNDELYILGISSEYGDLLISKSDDDGKTWCRPEIIMRGSAGSTKSGFHKAPVPVISKDDKIVTAVEYGSWEEKSFSNIILSANKNDNLMDCKSWNISKPFKPCDFPHDEKICGGIEGNVCTGNNNELFNILRLGENKALILKADENYNELEYVKTADFPMGHSKFEIVKYNNRFYAVGNKLPLRNILSVYSSSDLEKWDFEGDVVNFSEEDKQMVGFQYPSVIADDGELLVLSRTAYNGADSFHNSNCISFHRFRLDIKQN